MRESRELERKISINNRLGTVEDTPRAAALFAAMLRGVREAAKLEKEQKRNAQPKQP
jgi:hypothetical protein